MAAVGGVNNEPYFGNCELVTDHGLDHGPQYADRALLGQSGPVQNRSGLAGPRFLDWTVATLISTFPGGFVRLSFWRQRINI